jgi:hypothetical protein
MSYPASRTSFANPMEPIAARRLPQHTPRNQLAMSKALRILHWPRAWLTPF